MKKGIPHRAAVRERFWPSIVEARKKEYAGCLRLVAGKLENAGKVRLH